MSDEGWTCRKGVTPIFPQIRPSSFEIWPIPWPKPVLPWRGIKSPTPLSSWFVFRYRAWGYSLRPLSGGHFRCWRGQQDGGHLTTHMVLFMDSWQSSSTLRLSIVLGTGYWTQPHGVNMQLQWPSYHGFGISAVYHFSISHYCLFYYVCMLYIIWAYIIIL